MDSDVAFRGNNKSTLLSVAVGGLLLAGSIYIAFHIRDFSGWGLLAAWLFVLAVAAPGVWIIISPFIRPSRLLVSSTGITYSRGSKQTVFNWAEIKDIYYSTVADGLDGSVQIVAKDGRLIYVSPYFEFGMNYKQLTRRLLIQKYISEGQSSAEAEKNAEKILQNNYKDNAKGLLVFAGIAVIAVLVLVIILLL